MMTLQKITGWLVVLLIPIFLLMTAIRLMITPVFLQIEYRTPGFPADPYGFSFEERLHYARIAVDYLVNDAGIEYLGELEFENGSQLYNERELSHMVDVKVLVQRMIVAWYILLIVLLATTIWAWRAGWLVQFWSAVSTGGWFTIGLIVAGLIYVALNFVALFTNFHEIFFQSGTWTFEFSDTLIRLFPLRFWQDAFIAVGGFTLIAALLLGIFGRRWSRSLT